MAEAGDDRGYEYIAITDHSKGLKIAGGRSLAWHRKGFRLFWSWKVRHGEQRRPAISRQISLVLRRVA
jgi:histidinol phosphatase-like PHP family hydrolase